MGEKGLYMNYISKNFAVYNDRPTYVAPADRNFGRYVLQIPGTARDLIKRNKSDVGEVVEGPKN